MCLGVPGLVEELTNTEPLQRSAMVNFGGIRREINLAYVPEADTGDYVLVHVGFALSKIDEQEAQRTLAYLEQLEEPAEPGSGAS